MAPSGLAESFIGAIQASISVLLVIFYGGLAAHLKLLDSQNTKAISKVSVRMFLPALLITQVGSQLEPTNAKDYATVLMWAIFCHSISFLIGVFAHLALGMPDWTTVAIMFNNTTSYPLLLIAALNQTGILESLLTKGETVPEAIGRAKAFFLVFATVSSCLTFAVGPRLVDSEHAPEDDKDDADSACTIDRETEEALSENTALLGGDGGRVWAGSLGDNTIWPSRRRLSGALYNDAGSHRRAVIVPRIHWSRMGPRTQWWLLFLSDFFNAPMVGALVGAVIGLTPTLHRAFFNDTFEGGVLSAWLTESLKTIGELFVPLPIVVAGVSLYSSLKQSWSGDGPRTAKTPWIPVLFITIIRFVVWPLASIGIIYVLAKETEFLGQDPMLWFALMLMPTGPPAMKLITLVQVSNGGAEEEMSIAKLLALSYLISPILSFTVVASLKASQSCIT